MIILGLGSKFNLSYFHSVNQLINKNEKKVKLSNILNDLDKQLRGGGENLSEEKTLSDDEVDDLLEKKFKEVPSCECHRNKDSLVKC